MSPTRRTESLPKTARVRRHGEYVRAQREGRRYQIPGFTVLLRPNGSERARLGVTVSAKVGPAVRRNRIRRVVREVFRRNRALFPQANDVVFIARPGGPNVQSVTYANVRAEVARVSRRWAAGKGASR